MLLTEIIYNAQELISGMKQSDDNPLTDRQVAFIIQEVRLDVAPKDKSHDNKIVTKECRYRTTSLLPPPIQTNRKDLITYVGSEDGEFSYSRLSITDLQFLNYRRYASTIPSYIIRNREIELINPKTDNVKHVLVRGVFENPIEVNDLKCERLNTYEGLNFEYPVSSTMLDTIFKMMVEAEFKIGLATENDEINDSRKSTNVQQPSQ
jgi:hypothetical protein